MNQCYRIFPLFLFLNIAILHSQEKTVSGKVTEAHSNEPIPNASVVIRSASKILSYSYSDEEGSYVISVPSASSLDSLFIEANSFGFESQRDTIFFGASTALEINFKLSPKIEELNTVVLKSDEKIKINRDTISYKVSAFANDTEQTVEDLLKNIPGIEVDDDGNIKAQGKNIQKILIEGDDLADKNYKVISQNLDAKVLNEVQVINNYNENPILKKFLDSEAVAINLKLKDKSKSIWFGSAQLGAGNDDRYLADIDLGLIRPEIKFLDLGNFNSTGSPAGDQLKNYIYGSAGFNDYDENYEYSPSLLLSLRSASILIDDPFYKENRSFSNNLLANKSIWESSKLRNSLFAYRDEIDQFNSANTQYFLPDGTIDFSEENGFANKDFNVANDFQLRHPINENNYLTFQNQVSAANDQTVNDLLFNGEQQILQNLENQNFTIDNHLHFTKTMGEGILSLYGFTGLNFTAQKFAIHPNTVAENSDTNNSQLLDNVTDQSIYQGIKGDLLFKVGNLTYSLGGGLQHTARDLNFETENVEAGNATFIDSLSQNNGLENLETFLKLKGQYTLVPEKLFLQANLELKYLDFQNSTDAETFTFFNPNLRLRSKTALGNFNLSYTQNYELPEITLFYQGYLVRNYRSIQLGVNEIKPLKRESYAFNYIFSRRKKQILFDAGLSYSKNQQRLIPNSLLSENLDLTQFTYADGGNFLVGRAGLTTYVSPIDMTAKIGYTVSRFESTFVLNGNSVNLINRTDNYYLRGTTYWKGALNFKFSTALNVNKGGIGNTNNTNTTFKSSLETILKFGERLTGNLENSFYVVNGEFYETSSLRMEYNHKKGYVFGIQAQNLFGTANYTFSSISNFQQNDLIFQAVPAYILGYAKFRF